MEEPHTAPHDELVTIVQDLIQKASGRVVTIDTLANALKSRGFSRPRDVALIVRDACEYVCRGCGASRGWR